jgi:hypothetical protein
MKKDSDMKLPAPHIFAIGCLVVFGCSNNVLRISTWNSQTNGATCVDGILIVPV